MDRPIFSCGDTVILKKAHPCSSQRFLILRVGSDVRVKCEGCGREVTLDRIKFEKMIKKTVPKNDGEIQASDKKGTTV